MSEADTDWQVNRLLAKLLIAKTNKLKLGTDESAGTCWVSCSQTLPAASTFPQMAAALLFFQSTLLSTSLSSEWCLFAFV